MHLRLHLSAGDTRALCIAANFAPILHKRALRDPTKGTFARALQFSDVLVMPKSSTDVGRVL